MPPADHYAPPLFIIENSKLQNRLRHTLKSVLLGSPAKKSAARISVERLRISDGMCYSQKEEAATPFPQHPRLKQELPRLRQDE